MENKNAKIFVAHHKPAFVIQNDILVPVHVGAAKANSDFGLVRDDTGDNISEKNDRYCELTAIYWAWKNVDADYYGFSHYRRYFIFKDIDEKVREDGQVRFEYLTDEAVKICGLDENNIMAALQNCDAILPIEADIAAMGELANQIQYATSYHSHMKDYDKACGIVKKLYPDYSKDVDDYNASEKALWCNMFIFNRSIFFEYCEWLFNVVDHLDEQIDYAFYSVQECRAVAFIAERLLGIYVTHMKRTKPLLRIKHLKLAFFKEVESALPIMPAFVENNIPIAVSVNEKYVPFLGIMLHSLLTHSDKSRNYDVLLLHKKKSVSDNSIRLLRKTISEFKNARIRFIDVSQFTQSLNLYLTDHFSVETYFRLFLPKILGNYKKIIYLDADMVVMNDISPLFDVDLEGNSIAAVRDVVAVGALRKPDKAYTDNINTLELAHPLNYFQAGLLVISLDALREGDLFQDMISYAASHNCKFVDQDVLNRYLHGKVKFLEQRWNVEISSGVMDFAQYVPADLYREYMDARENGYIYHFCGVLKPWENLTIDYSEIFWTAARKTIWYEIVMESFIDLKTSVTKLPLYERLHKEIIKYPNYIGSSVIPIMKAFNELSEIGLSDQLTDAIRSIDQNLLQGESLILYGAGKRCRKILTYFDEVGISYPTQIWDKSAKPGQQVFGVPVVQPDFQALRNRTDVQCLITIKDEKISNIVKQAFFDNGINNVIDEKTITKILSAKMWLKLEEKLKSNSDGQ